jgi:hypothetical protein
MSAMLRIFFLIICAGWGAVCAAASMSSGYAVDGAGQQEAPNRLILVTFPSVETSGAIPAGGTRKLYRSRDRYNGSPIDVRTVRLLSEKYGVRKLSEWPIAALAVHCVVYEVPGSADMEGVIARLQKDPVVESVQRMQHFRVQSQTQIYNDPYWDLQYGLKKMEVQNAHLLSKGDGVRVAVIDTGMDIRHPELMANIQDSRDFVASDASEFFNRDIHGTAVAGVIAAAAGNGMGVVGVAPKVRLLALKACWQESSDSSAAVCNSFTLAQAISYAIEHGARILNMSLSGPEDPLLVRLVNVALQKNIIVVGAYDNCAAFPSSIAGVIAVAAQEDIQANKKTCRSEFGPQIYAPGIDIITTLPGNRYDFMSGNSLAAAHATGVIALLLERKKLSGQEILALLNLQQPGSFLNACYALAQMLGAKADCAPYHPQASLINDLNPVPLV